MILECQDARTSDYARRTSALTETRKAFKRRRDAGLKRRHAEKLARIRAAQNSHVGLYQTGRQTPHKMDFRES